jgi:hypothetical protein
MIQLQWHDPNFECEIELGSDREWRLAWGKDEVDVREKLVALGFTVHGVKPYVFEKGWKKSADEAAALLRSQGKPAHPADWKKQIWTNIKAFLFLLSNGKCGYCESNVRPASKGDVEHYRPKGAVSGEPAHPGYYWLAYEITNYIPTCSDCNSGKGKRNQFPIIDPKKRVSTWQADLATESPLLLHPFRSDPAKHLRVEVSDAIQTDIAVIVAKDGSIIGEESRKVYNLNRGDLVAARRKAMSDAIIVFNSLDQGKEEGKKTFQRIIEGRDPYTLAQLTKLSALLDEKRRETAAYEALLPKL